MNSVIVNTGTETKNKQSFALEDNTAANICVARLIKKDYKQLLDLFSIIHNDPTASKFHPHLFNKEQANNIANYTGADLYVGFFKDQRLLGYGLLRGWDAGYKIPSLGIYLCPEARGNGLSIHFMKELHRMAAKLNATSVRLKVYPDNIKALNLYKKMGYLFNSEEEGQCVGYISL